MAWVYLSVFSSLWPTLPPGHLVTQSWPPSALGWSLLVAGPRPGPAIAAHTSGCGHLSPFLLCKACKPCTFLRGEVGLPQLG